MNPYIFDLTCKRGSVGQSEGLLIPRSSVRFRLKTENSNSHGFETHGPSIKGTKLLLKLIKAIIVKRVLRYLSLTKRKNALCVYVCLCCVYVIYFCRKNPM